MVDRSWAAHSRAGQRTGIVETLLTTGLCLVAGEITTSAYVDLPGIARDTIREVGYNDSRMGFDYRTCGVISAVDEQSPVGREHHNADGAVAEIFRAHPSPRDDLDHGAIGVDPLDEFVACCPCHVPGIPSGHVRRHDPRTGRRSPGRHRGTTPSPARAARVG